MDLMLLEDNVGEDLTVRVDAGSGCVVRTRLEGENAEIARRRGNGLSTDSADLARSFVKREGGVAPSRRTTDADAMNASASSSPLTGEGAAGHASPGSAAEGAPVTDET